MALHFTSLPQNVAAKICKFLANSSLKRLREVSTSTMKIIALSIIRNNPYVHSFTISGSNTTSGVTISFDFFSPRYLIIWACWIRYVSKHFQISDYKIEKSKAYSRTISVRMNTDQMELFLRHTKQNVPNMIIRFIGIDCYDPNVARIFTDFLRGQNKLHFSVTARIGMSSEEFCAWMPLLRQCNSWQANFFAYPLNAETAQILMQLADCIKSIRVFLMTKRDTKLDLVPVVRDILNRKCENLCFASGNVRDATLSMSEIEQLVQQLHSLDKKFCFWGYTDEDDMEKTKIGEIEMLIEFNRSDNTGSAGNGVLIKHVEFK